MFATFSHLVDLLNHHIIFGIGILLVVGYFIGKLAEKMRLPAITGYLITGLILGDSGTGIIHLEMTESLRTITDIALGIIAITIGSEFGIGKLRRLGKGIVIITIVQLIFTFAMVSISLMFFKMDILSALLLGAIASATAPAATVIIIQNLRARGDFVDTLYGVVALDDAACVMLFAGVFAMVSGMMGGGHAEPFIVSMGHASSEIVFSLLLGAAEGFLLLLLVRKIKRENELLIVCLGAVLFFTALAVALHLSLLLSNMMAGAVLINTTRLANRVFRVIKPLTPPLYAAFFAIAGTEIDLQVLMNKWVLGVGTVYVLARGIGKYSGVYVGSKLAGSPARIQRYLGFSMLPQAGVAIGLTLLIQASPALEQATPAVKESMTILTNIVLFGVTINELIGPPLSKFAIIRGADL